jgi:hypothetical protein
MAFMERFPDGKGALLPENHRRGIERLASLSATSGIAGKIVRGCPERRVESCPSAFSA